MNGRFDEPIYYAVKNLNKDIVKTSSSGGLFSAICKHFFKSSGVAYGAAYNNELQVHHEAARNFEECSKFRGSKYVMSELTGIYKDIRKHLDGGQRVLFSGTPCQVAGLYSYLGKTDISNLLTCDLICHGVPSQDIFNQFLEELGNDYNSRAVSVNFKDKYHGWRSPYLRIEFENGAVYSEFIWNSLYGILYHSRFTVMPACNNCKYATVPRLSDITIGDFWGYSSDKHGLGNEDEGVSIAIINTKKGLTFFESIKPEISYREVEWSEAKQLHLEKSANAPSEPIYKYYLKLRKRKITLAETEKKIQKMKKRHPSKLKIIVSRIRGRISRILH
ncbi:MAG: Coenzyme F420 hydrogenase/dehydrogenase, beta subunit C-terminal domain [Clostridia bacterium]|nr:Coenzyme F420 hydrogenase/dehydrogenase, beta subunit C-terminal domain [Clostridia bacterium]